MIRASILSLALLALVPAESTAQWHSKLEPGNRIEIRWPKGQTAFTGVLIHATTDSLWMRRDGDNDTLRVAVDSLDRVRVSRGRARSVGRSAGKGFLIGAGIGAGFGVLAAASDPEFSEFFDGPAGGAAIFGVLFGVPGFVLGGLFGLSSEAWDTVPLPGRP